MLQGNQLEQQLTGTRDALAARDAQLTQANASVAAMRHAGDAKDKLLLDMRDAVEEAEQGEDQWLQFAQPTMLPGMDMTYISINANDYCSS